MDEKNFNPKIPHMTIKDFCRYFQMSHSKFYDWKYPDVKDEETLKKRLQEKKLEGKSEENLIRTLKPFGTVLITYDEVQRLEKLKRVGW